MAKKARAKVAVHGPTIIFLKVEGVGEITRSGPENWEYQVYMDSGWTAVFWDTSRVLLSEHRKKFIIKLDSWWVNWTARINAAKAG